MTFELILWIGIDTFKLIGSQFALILEQYSIQENFVRMAQ